MMANSNEEKWKWLKNCHNSSTALELYILLLVIKLRDPQPGSRNLDGPDSTPVLMKNSANNGVMSKWWIVSLDARNKVMEWTDGQIRMSKAYLQHLLVYIQISYFRRKKKAFSYALSDSESSCCASVSAHFQCWWLSSGISW